MAILEVENSSGNPWVGCHVRVNDKFPLIVPQSGRLDLAKYGPKVSLTANGVILRVNEASLIILERDTLLVARYCIQKGSFFIQKRTMERKETILGKNPIK